MHGISRNRRESPTIPARQRPFLIVRAAARASVCVGTLTVVLGIATGCGGGADGETDLKEVPDCARYLEAMNRCVKGIGTDTASQSIETRRALTVAAKDEAARERINAQCRAAEEQISRACR